MRRPACYKFNTQLQKIDLSGRSIRCDGHGYAVTLILDIFPSNKFAFTFTFRWMSSFILGKYKHWSKLRKKQVALKSVSHND